MNILVTGGAGFIGSHTVISLKEAGFTPIIVDNFSNSSKSVLAGLKEILGEDVRHFEADCNDAAALTSIVKSERIEGVIHFAASKAVGESMEEPLLYYRNNLGSLLTVLEVMQACGIKNLIFSSSCTVYGEPAVVPVTESTPVKPASSVYGNTKQIGEEILRDVAAAKAFKIIALRYFNPVGAHPSGLIGELPLGVPNNLAPYVAQTASGLREAITVFGDDYPTPDGTCVRDYIHVMDLAEAHVAALNHLIKTPDLHFYDVFNVGTGKGDSVLSLIQTFEKVNQLKLNYRIGPRRAGDIIAIWGDVEKSKRILGWSSKRTLEDALRDTWRWQRHITQNA